MPPNRHPELSRFRFYFCKKTQQHCHDVTSFHVLRSDEFTCTRSLVLVFFSIFLVLLLFQQLTTVRFLHTVTPVSFYDRYRSSVYCFYVFVGISSFRFMHISPDTLKHTNPCIFLFNKLIFFLYNHKLKL